MKVVIALRFIHNCEKVQKKGLDIIQQIIDYLIYFGYRNRRKPSLMRNILKGHGKRKRGRPRLQYVDYVARLINNDEPPSIDEIKEAAADRKRWYNIVIACKPHLFAVG